MIPIDAPGIQKLVADNPYYVVAAIPGGIYTGVDKDVPTFAVKATFVTSDREPEAEGILRSPPPGCIAVLQGGALFDRRHDRGRVTSPIRARFEGIADGNSLLMARWSIVGADGKRELLARQSSFSEPIGPPQDYEATVSAMSRTLADLSREIAAAIKTLSQQTPQR